MSWEGDWTGVGVEIREGLVLSGRRKFKLDRNIYLSPTAALKP